MDKIVSKIAGLGVPGLVLVIAISTSGLAGGAAIVVALSTLGGPFGMVGGLALLGMLVLISNALAKFGFERVFEGTLKKLREKGMSKSEILQKVDRYPISRELKLKLRDAVEQAG